MKPHPRWLTSVIAAAALPQPALPWERGPKGQRGPKAPAAPPAPPRPAALAAR
ncbi:MAG: hypothetical protein ACK414_05535 [Gemmobacter sp.]